MSKKVFIKPNPINFHFTDMLKKRLKITKPVNIILKKADKPKDDEQS